MDKGGVRYEQGTRQAALANGERLLASKPATAALQARALIDEDRQDASAIRLLARALDLLGEAAAASSARLDAIRLSRQLPEIKAAHSAISQDRAGEVPGMLEGYLAANPDDAVAHWLLGEAFARSNRVSNARPALERAVALAPEFDMAHYGLARLHYQCFDPAAGLAALEPLMRQQPVPLDMRRFRATLLAESGDYEAALALHRALADDCADHGEILIGLGDALRWVGETNGAAQSYRAALALKPPALQAWWSLAGMGGMRIADAEIPLVEERCAKARDPDIQAALHFAAAKALDVRGDLPRAFGHYCEGNRHRRNQLTYDSADFSARQAAISQTADAAFFAKRRSWGEQSSAPIFVLGMPRSGSTLVEQMLGGHPNVEACGEMPAIPALLHETAGRLGLDVGRDIVQLLQRLSASDCAALGKEYLHRTAPRRRLGRERFTDKLPHNWAELAFIRLILPNAGIVDMRRNPHDCCLSNFTLLFAPGHPSSYDLGEMAEYYGTYLRFMRQFEVGQPGAVCKVLHEQLVEDPESQLRQLLGGLGLPWDSACLDFSTGKRTVATASAEQVRRPLNRDGMNTWRRFEPWLGDLLPRLDALAAECAD